MTNKTEITIEGDSIIYNGVKYQKVQEESKKKTPNFTFILADKFESLVNGMYIDYTDICCNVDVIAHELLEELSRYIPDYSDWEDALKEFPEGTFSEGESRYFRDGWNAYCKKMWDMINGNMINDV